ncbi:hypothetical protein A3K29_04180 [Candidatus Collierbacteria bacterium RIFOXYB2_FULL_46_14]|uniref:Monogalactosyldiacylglycerol synthase n=1 Tax=Candidatus Collierbacteria bacterium GW2011_GWA2_46_26 TaxID=1618381 RepID=A0A0G1PL11_9BACT|nr:MAG: hypothetical protein UW29_C0002G0022 [Candidatus Collierbacteria bacterium GW2011_GWC2_44_13]KKU33499.1 MAG: hypothetical protein UX47_C0003G0022 [Candidatus Collierbacteria bacterium GW2011_GWA2_46_26]OGD73302.1 MAG: hypothetical protein A3K29_04180 [Candidatus Collierbacteria bacterium RIFOXYB2_FULL_46_14]OGD76344.1 MAG: hypothetical protein A3K43_04180 [Candidatus Collierbacteria bacterium RIFOXYA2_FULL_46_20]OGD77680.1 MAG: hypothetical protein A3K39_04180 [Candidatus Collierbacteri
MKLLIFTYAPAGLGHLRVTDALAESRPKNSQYVLLGSIDRFVTWIHRFTSINPFGKYIFLRSQYGVLEDTFTNLYRIVLIMSSRGVLRELKEILLHNPECEDVWVVATHFGMAHQVGAIKEKLSKETGRNVKLIVQVTDDTYQHIWCVRGADLTFLPSKFVQKKFEKYAAEHNIPFVSEVIPYPLSSLLTNKLAKSMGLRQKVFSEKIGKINVAIPVSGAAVGLSYFTDLIQELKRVSDRFEFWVLVKKSPFTEMFISSMSRIANVKVLVGKNDIQMIELYELLYEKNLIHLEVTKPSEQAFKAIIYPTNVGGSVLLFTSPVGRQEKENIKFLERHRLMPNSGQATAPRAIRLSVNPKIAARFIKWGVNSGLFRKMTSPNFKFSRKCLSSGEVGPGGAELFWKRVEKRFGK